MHVLGCNIEQMFRNLLSHKTKRKNEINENEVLINDEHDIVVNATQQIEQAVATTIEVYQGVLDGLFKEDRKNLSKLYKIADEFHGKCKRQRAYEVLPTLQRLNQASLDTGQYYVQAVDYSYEISVSLRYITKSGYDFIDNAKNRLKT